MPDDAIVLQERTGLAEADVNRSQSDADAAQKEYVRSLVKRCVEHDIVNILCHQQVHCMGNGYAACHSNARSNSSAQHQQHGSM